jgi:hypothetical protein
MPVMREQKLLATYRKYVIRNFIPLPQVSVFFCTAACTALLLFNGALSFWTALKTHVQDAQIVSQM